MCEPTGADDNTVLEVACHDCGLDPLCEVLGYGKHELCETDAVLMRRQPVQRGAVLFRPGQPFYALFAIKSGSFKAVSVDLSGKERVVGFFLPGDLIGTEGIANHVYSYAVRALEESSVCKLAVNRLLNSGQDTEKLQAALIRMLGQEVVVNHLVTTSLIQQNAEQRIAAFILSLSKRSGLRGMPQYQLILSMSRSDIASYLGLARETVSRVLTKFQNYGLIGLRKHVLKVLNPEGLEKATIFR
ncbi:MAG: helix-turn-helix domain-containing protein [Candidatus Thiodiazotropha sp. LLP2]